VEYCRRDVELTWELYRFGCENGYLRYWDAHGRLREVPVSWTGPPVPPAFRRHHSRLG